MHLSQISGPGWDAVRAATEELLRHRRFSFIDDGVPIKISSRDAGLQISYDGSTGEIGYGRPCEFFRALALFEEQYAAGGQAAVALGGTAGGADAPEPHCTGTLRFDAGQQARFSTLCAMFDNSRNAVQTVATMKDLIRIMAMMGYNALMLYTEDTFEMPGHPYFGYMRGRFTAAELREIDDYAALFGIEAIPCTQTLAHLNAIFRWPDYSALNDIDDILIVGDEKVYELIDAIVGTLSGVYRSRRINIGMDEAWRLGQGKYSEKNGYTPKSDMMARHLRRVMDICRKHGMQPMMWSDMFFRMGDPEFEAVDGALSEQAIAKIPEGVTLIHWDYVTEDKDKLDDELRVHKLTTRDVAFAGGAWKWAGLSPFIGYSLRVSEIALRSCLEGDIRQVIVTCWGDGGGEASNYTVLPELAQYAEACYTGDAGIEAAASRLAGFFGISLDDMLLLDLPNQLPGHGGKCGYAQNPGVYLLYQDILMGLFDKHVKPDEFRRHYAQSRDRLQAAAPRAGRFGYIFSAVAALCDLLTDKAGMGLRIKAAYDNGDASALRGIAEGELPELLRKAEAFYECLYTQWHKENKPHGFDIQDLRLGALMQRLKAVRRTLLRYLDGDIDSIPELMEERLYFDGRSEEGDCIHTRTNIWRWSDAVTVNAL